jgi:hypothetical protein
MLEDLAKRTLLNSIFKWREFLEVARQFNAAQRLT